MIRRFGRQALGIGAAIAMLAGCDGGSRLPVDGSQALRTFTRTTKARARPHAPNYVYVLNWLRSSPNSSAVDIYPAALSGNIPPSTVISGSQTQLAEPGGIVVDRSGEIYVAVIDADEIVEFARGSSGNVSPTVVISGSHTTLSRPTGLALDGAGNLYVANCASGCGVGSASPGVLEFAAGASGNVAPIRVISGSYTHLTNANAVALDSSGYIYISNYLANTIVVFVPSAKGNVRPTRIIEGSKTLLDSPEGLAVDSHGLWAGSSNDHFLERFRPDANGNVSPLAMISGNRTGIGNVDGIAVDSNGAVYASNPSDRSILEFAAGANGNVRPIGRISGPYTQLVTPVCVYVR
jgi:sugar lactone lactonase YvrE